MVLGWLGLTVTGTLVTLWPTMLRTRIDAHAESLARQALPVLCGAVALVVAGALLDLRPLVVSALLLYAVGLGWWGRALWQPARHAPPREFGTWSVSAGLCWLVFAVLWVAGTVAWQSDWRSVVDGFTPATVGFAAGFGAQLVQGALTYLVPSVLGGGPTIVRSAGLAMDRWGAARIVVVNGGLVVALLPVPSAVRTVVSALVAATLAMFIPVLVVAVLDAVRTMRGPREQVAQSGELAQPAPPAPPAARPPGGFARHSAPAQRSTRRRVPRPAAGDQPRGLRRPSSSGTHAIRAGDPGLDHRTPRPPGVGQ
jgi:nitrite reductase (NO-forming)